MTIELENTSAKRSAVDTPVSAQDILSAVSKFYHEHWTFILLKSGGWRYEDYLSRAREYDITIDELEIRVYPVASDSAYRISLGSLEARENALIRYTHELYLIPMIIQAYYMRTGNNKYYK